MLASSGEITAPCPVPISLMVTTPSSRTPALSHFWIRRIMRRSPIRCSTNLITHSWLTVSKNEPDNQRIHRIMRAAPGSESVREPEEVFLVDRVEHRSCRPLDDLVFQGRNRERALTPVRLGYVHAP